MQNADTAITDFMITLASVFFIYRLNRVIATEHDMRRHFIGLFVSVGLASLAGGIAHGWYESTPELFAAQLCWKFAMVFLGVAAFYVYRLCFSEFNLGSLKVISDWLLLLALMAYGYVILFVDADFSIAVKAYVPSLMVWLTVVMWRFFKTKSVQFLLAVVGLAISFLAIFIQVSHWVIHPDYLDHNALYHLVQIWGLYFIYRFAEGRVQWMP
jgi:hypothetical protein